VLDVHFTSPFQAGSEIVNQFFKLLFTCHGRPPHRQDKRDLPTESNNERRWIGRWASAHPSSSECEITRYVES
jgi:hypothetical protein